MHDANDHIQPDGPTFDELLVHLSDPTRRSILLILAEQNSHSTDEFTSVDYDTDIADALFEAEVRYDHLPQLVRAGFIEWNREFDTVTRGPNFDQVRPLITLIHEHQDELPDDWFDPDR